MVTLMCSLNLKLLLSCKGKETKNREMKILINKLYCHFLSILLCFRSQVLHMYTFRQISFAGLSMILEVTVQGS